MSEKKPTEIKNLKPGGFVVLEDVPYVVDKIQLSKSGKHGASKARLFASGMFTESKKIIVKPGDSRVDVPIIEKLTAQVVATSGHNVTVMDNTNYETFEIPVPEELRDKLVEGDEVLIWRWERFLMIKGKK